MKPLKLWLPVIIWAGIIFLFSSIPNLKTDLEYDFFLRKVAHITEYFIFTFLLFRAFAGSFRMGGVSFICPAVFSFLYVISDEIHQYFVPGRHCSFADILIDSTGIICFYILVVYQRRARGRLFSEAR
ncbi:MAG: VanZ family protein [Candidatus Omnitrophica bacterium]|nr:VanZ family protein [Candidatus Omnitrophota bacterium]